MANENADLSYWQSQLDEVTDELSEITGATGFSVGGLSVDEKSAFDQLLKQKAHCEHMITRLGSGSASTANVIVTEPDEAY